jgi:putative tricarboxylic transport membrane protein
MIRGKIASPTCCLKRRARKEKPSEIKGRLTMHRSLLAAGATVLAAALGAAPPAAAQIQGLEIVVPAAPGGGWDQTGRAMQSALQEDGLASGIQVVNIPGAGGTIGLAQFVSSKEGQGNALLTGGLVMLGAILTNQSPVTLDQVTPIARLTGEYEAIVVPASSEIQTLDALIAKFKEDPQSVSWGGGSAGGTDHMLVGLIAKQADVDPGGINYVPFAGGGEALASILGGHVTAGVSGYQEFAGQIETGDLRALAISSAERLEGIDIPTLKEQGVDVELTNWRAVFAPPGISDADKQALGDAVGQMAKSEAWQGILTERAWLDLYLPPDEFAQFLKEDTQQVETVLKDIGLVQ